MEKHKTIMLLVISIVIISIVGIIFLNKPVDIGYKKYTDNYSNILDANHSNILDANKHRNIEDELLKEQTGINREYLFSWDDVPGNNSNQFIDYLKDDLRMAWVKNAKITKSADGKTITVIHPDDTASIKIDKQAFGGDFTAGNGTYLFKIHSPLFSKQDNMIVGAVIDIKLPNGTEVQAAAKTNIISVVENVEIYVLNVTMTGDIPATADVTADVKVYDMQGKNSIVFRLNEHEGRVILEIAGVREYEYILRKENGKMNVYYQNTETKLK